MIRAAVERRVAQALCEYVGNPLGDWKAYEPHAAVALDAAGLTDEALERIATGLCECECDRDWAFLRAALCVEFVAPEEVP